VTQAGWDVKPPNACEGIPREKKRRRRPRRGNALEGESPARQRRAGSFGILNGRTSSRRDRSPERGRVRTLPMGVRRIDVVNAKRAGRSGRGADRREEKALKGEA
jgi:hypothetical protein